MLYLSYISTFSLNYSDRPSFFLFAVCTAPIDLGFLIEATSSFMRSQSRQVKRFLEGVVRRFTISTRAARIGLMSYASRAIGLLKFTGSYSQRLVNNVIYRIRALSGGRRFGAALYYAKQYLFSGIPQCGRRRILICVTAGASTDQVRRPAVALEGAGVEIFMVGVGRVNRGTLMQVATDSRHVFMVGFTRLNAIIRTLKDRICYSPGMFLL